MEHTPGPWEVDQKEPWVINSGWGCIAEAYFGQVIGNNGQRKKVASGEAEANAHLIAAAPDLLEALIVACRDIENEWGCGNSESGQCVNCPIGRTIAIAKGGC